MKRNDYRVSAATTRTGHMRRFVTAAAAALAGAALALTMAGAPAMASQEDVMDKASPHGQMTAKPMQPTGYTPGTVAPEAKDATVLVYLNGSDLESEAGEATSDIAEMMKSGVGENVNVVIETLGTKQWQNYGIASDHTQRYLVSQGELQLVDDNLGQLDTTSPDTLADFISWGVANYPADRYMLVLWDHGAGPVYGFGYDEFQSEGSALTLDEMQEALEANSDVHFDFIGMDCCIMSSLETYYVLAPFCDYAILSEDFEPGIGWSYTNWMAMLEKNPSVGTVELGSAIVDDMVGAVAQDPENGEATLALVDESAVPALYSAWVEFSYENKDMLLGSNYSQEVSAYGREGSETGGSRPAGQGGSFDMGGWNHGYCYGFDEGSWNGDGSGHAGEHGSWNGDGGMFDYWDYDGSYVTMSDYYVTDIMAVASTVESDKATALETVMGDAIVHFNCTEGDADMTGMGVTLPYGDAEFYDELADVFSACEIDGSYIAWLEDFVQAEGASSYYDYGAFDDSWSGWNSFYDERDWYGYGSSNEYGYGDGYGHGGGSYGYDDYGYGYDDGYEYGYDDGHGYDYGYGYDGGYGRGYGFDVPGMQGGWHGNSENPAREGGLASHGSSRGA